MFTVVVENSAPTGRPLLSLILSVVRKCGIKQTDLLNKPKLSEVLPRFISWIKNLTDEVSTLTKRKYFPGTYTTV